MLRVGLTGGFATGKSNVGRVLAELGCRVISADKLGHQALGTLGLRENATLHREVVGTELEAAVGEVDVSAVGQLADDERVGALVDFDFSTIGEH